MQFDEPTLRRAARQAKIVAKLNGPSTVKFKPISVDRYDEMLGILPPACYLAHGFLVGEPWRHNALGQPMFAPFLEIDGRYYEGDAPLTIADFRALNPRAALKGG